MIYFIRDTGTGLVKVGCTGDSIAARLASLQTGNPSLLEVLGTVPGGRKVERALHARLAGEKVRGEWFRPTPATALVFRRMTRRGQPTAAGLVWWLRLTNERFARDWDRWAQTEPWRCRTALILAGEHL